MSDKFLGEICHMSNSRFDGGTVRVKNHCYIKIQIKIDFGIYDFYFQLLKKLFMVFRMFMYTVQHQINRLSDNGANGAQCLHIFVKEISEINANFI